MASLTLKNIPDVVLRALRASAESDRRSLNQQVIHLLAGALGVTKGKAARRPPDVEAQVAAWRKLAGMWDSDLDLATETEQLRRARSPGRKVDL